MTSAIDASKPVLGAPTTQSVRDNFAAAKSEIEALQEAMEGLGDTYVRLAADNVMMSGGWPLTFKTISTGFVWGDTDEFFFQNANGRLTIFGGLGSDTGGLLLRTTDLGGDGVTSPDITLRPGTVTGVGSTRGVVWMDGKARVTQFLDVGADAGALTPLLRLVSAAGQNRQLVFATGANTRFMWMVDSGAEAGANAGSNMQLYRFSDGGTLLGTVMDINRATGAVTILPQLNLAASAGANLRSGTGAATGTQPSGSLWIRTDGTAGNRIYVSQGGGTWLAVAGV